MQVSPPPFVPKPAPVGRYLLFVLTPGIGYGAKLAACHADDLDDAIEAIPPGPGLWQIFDLNLGRIVASSDPEIDREHTPIPGEGGIIVFAERTDAWGAWCAERRATMIGTAGQWLQTSNAIVCENGEPAAIVPSLEQIKEYQDFLSTWVLEQYGQGNEVTLPDADATDLEARNWSGAGILPPNWSELPTAELAAIVEQAEARLGIVPKTEPKGKGA